MRQTGNKKSINDVWQSIGMFFYRNHRYTTLLWLFFVGFGILSYTTLMRREGFPSINVPIGVVQVVTFQDSASTVDQEFTLPIVEILSNDDRVKNVVASSTDKGAGITIVFEEGTRVENALSNIQIEVDKLDLSETAKVLFIPVNAGKFTSEGDDVLITVYGEGLTPQELDILSAELATKLTGKSDLIDRAKPLELMQTAPNPRGGDPITIQRSFDRYYSKSFGESLPAAVVAVRGVDGVDQLKLHDEVDRLLAEIELSDNNVSRAISANFADGIRDQVSSLQRNLFEGLLVVLIVSFVLISLRASVITAIAMASTVAITVGVLHAIGFTLNTITLFSLVLCLALIVDDTTIMIEAIDKGVAEKKTKLESIIADSLRRVARASSTGTLVTALAFAPMLFISGILGEFIRAIPITIIVSLFVSLLVSVIFIPLMVRFSFKNREPKHKQRKVLIVDRAEKAVGRFLAQTIQRFSKSRRKKLTSRLIAVGIGTVFFISGMFVLSKAGFNIFPSQKDGNDIVIVAKVTNPETATIKTTEKLTEIVLDKTQTTLGDNLESITLTSQGGQASSTGFTASVVIADYKKRDTTSREYVERLNASFAELQTDIRVEAVTAGVGPPASLFTVRLYGDDDETLRELADQMEQFLSVEELTRVDGSKASFKDVSISPKNVQLRSQDGSFIEVSAGFSADDTSTLVTLAQDAVNQRFDAEYLRQIGLDAETVVFDLGQEQENQDSFSSMGKAALPLFVAMFIVMAILFKSFVQPVLIFTALPFAVFGVGMGLYLTDNVVSFFSMLGVFALIGISLNNTILLTDYANDSQSQGMSPDDAIADALQARLRPLITTSLTSVLALLPLALSDPFWQGLSFTLIFGLLSSTFLVITVFPYYYLIAEWIRFLPKRFFIK